MNVERLKTFIIGLVVIISTLASMNILIFSEGVPSLESQIYVTGRLVDFECTKYKGRGRSKTISNISVEGFEPKVYLHRRAPCGSYEIGSMVELYTYNKLNDSFEASMLRINDEVIIKYDSYVEDKDQTNVYILGLTLFWWGCLLFHFRKRNITSH